MDRMRLAGGSRVRWCSLAITWRWLGSQVGLGLGHIPVSLGLEHTQVGLGLGLWMGLQGRSWSRLETAWQL